MEDLYLPALDLRRHRISHGYSRSDLARRVGCSPASIVKWERGERVSERLQIPLARAVGVDLAILFGPETRNGPAGDGAVTPGVARQRSADVRKV